MAQNITEKKRVCHLFCLYLNNVSSIVGIVFPQKYEEKTIKNNIKNYKITNLVQNNCFLCQNSGWFQISEKNFLLM